MRIAFELMFYIMINLVPGKVDHFEATFDQDGFSFVMNFDRLPDNHWKMAIRNKAYSRKDSAEFWFDQDLANYYKKDGAGTKKIPFARKLDIKRNHKKWRKVTNVKYIVKYADETPKPSVAFEIKKEAKRKYMIKPIGNGAEAKSFPELRMFWE